MVQPATSNAGVSGQRLNFVDDANQSKPIKSVIVPDVPGVEPSEPQLSDVTKLPYRTRVNYKADHDSVPTSTVSQASANHVTTHSRSQAAPTRQVTTAGSQNTTSGQLINVTSPSTRDTATRIHINDHLDKTKHRQVFW